MIAKIRKSFETEEGQAIIIGSLMLLLLALGVLMTLNIGNAVKEKIRLQNTSDAAAYSMAVVEAQSFNFIAFSNRVQAAHYNGMMTLQSIATLMLFFESILGTVMDVVFSVATIIDLLGYIPPLAFLRGVARIIDLAGQAIALIVKGLNMLLHKDSKHTGDDDGIGLIPIIGTVKEFMWYLNLGQYFASVIVSGMVWSHILDGMSTVVTANDNRVETGLFKLKIFNIIFLAITGYEFYQTFDKSGGGIPPIPYIAFTGNNENGSLRPIKKDAAEIRSGQKKGSGYDAFQDRSPYLKQRQRVMAEIANATRTEWFNTKRGFADLPDVIKLFVDIQLKGQTKLVSRNREDNRFVVRLRDSAKVVNDIRKDDEYDHSRMPIGDAMASDQGFSLKITLANIITLAEFSLGNYILADNHGGEYWRWTPRNKKFSGKYANWPLMPGNPYDRGGGLLNMYIRLPVSLWDMFGFTVQAAIDLCIFVSSCYYNSEGETNPDVCNARPFIKGQGRCKSWLPFGSNKKCNNNPCCKFKRWTKAKVNTHRGVCGDKAGQFYYGIGPYLKFNPLDDQNLSDEKRRDKDFNQPSTWMFLTLEAEHLFDFSKPWMLNDRGEVSVDRFGTKKAEFSQIPKMSDGLFTESRPLGILDPGLNVMSRARVYYHRPGNWNEHPNFYNPFWRAQLAPIAQKLTNVVKSITNPQSQSEREQPSEGGIGGFLSQVGNSFNDILTNLVQSIISH